jgi:hypothetical protein
MYHGLTRFISLCAATNSPTLSLTYAPNTDSTMAGSPPITDSPVTDYPMQAAPPPPPPTTTGKVMPIAHFYCHPFLALWRGGGWMRTYISISHNTHPKYRRYCKSMVSRLGEDGHMCPRWTSTKLDVWCILLLVARELLLCILLVAGKLLDSRASSITCKSR